MKNAQQIVTHTLKPFSKRMESLKCISLMLSFLPKNLQDAVTYYYVRNEILYIYVTSSAFKMEFTYKASILKSLLGTIKKNSRTCSDFNFKSVKVYVKQDVKQRHRNLILVYRERAVGDFENIAKNSLVREKLEEIRSVIKSVES